MWCSVTPGSQLVIAIVERDAAFEDPLDHGGHVGSLEREPRYRVAHVASGAERHFAILHVEARGRELIEAAGVVVMHVGDDHILHLRRLDADHLQPLGGRAQQLALPFASHLGVESGIDHEGAIFTDNRPHEEVDGHGSIVRIAAQKVLTGPPRMVRVADRVDFVSIRCPSCYDLTMDKALFEAGLEVRKATLGKEFVENAIASADDFNRPLQEFVTEYCWGACWTRPGLPRKTRSMLNLAMLTALNRPHELKMHLKGALVNGVTRDEIREILLQTGVYCGVPAAVDAFRTAKEVFAELDKKIGKK